MNGDVFSADRFYSKAKAVGWKADSANAKEAARYAAYLGREAKAEMGRGYFAQANLDAELSPWHVRCSKYLAIMGR